MREATANHLVVNGCAANHSLNSLIDDFQADQSNVRYRPSVVVVPA